MTINTTTAEQATKVEHHSHKNNFHHNDVSSISSSNSDSNSRSHIIGDSIYDHPSMHEYYSNLTPFITLCIFVSALLLILNLSIFCTTLARLRKSLNKSLLRLTTALCSLYPIIAVAALVTIIVPKTWLVCHTVMHLSFTVGAVIFHRLCFRYVESEVNYIKETDGAAVAINTPPCCCCCMCLPAVVPSRTKFILLKYMIWQMPFVQGSIMMVLNGIYYKEPELYRNVMLYFIPFIVCSIIIGVWGLNITVRVVNNVHSDYSVMKKMFCLQLVLLLCKLQYLLLDSQLDAVTMGGSYPMNHTIYKQTIINTLILIEMVLVSILAQNAYRIPTQTKVNSTQ